MPPYKMPDSDFIEILYFLLNDSIQNHYQINIYYCRLRAIKTTNPFIIE